MIRKRSIAPHDRDATDLAGELHTDVCALCRRGDGALFEGEIAEAYVLDLSTTGGLHCKKKSYPLR